MHIAILTFEGFNELDSLIAFNILSRVPGPDWRVSIASPTVRVRSKNGLVIEAQASLAEASDADAVIVGSGTQTRNHVADSQSMKQLRLDPSRQLVGAQCSGAPRIHDRPSALQGIEDTFVQWICLDLGINFTRHDETFRFMSLLERASRNAESRTDS